MIPLSVLAWWLGYRRELQGIRARYQRCKTAWDPHLERTRDVIRSAIRSCSARRKAVILGSGWLLDVPLSDLTSAFREVVLVDLIHPWRVRWQCRRFANVSFHSADLSSVLAETYRVAHDGHAPLPRAAPMLFRDDPEVDLIASVNLLSQLPHLPADYLLHEGSHLPEAIEAFARDVIRAHLTYLRGFSATVALIADLERITVDRGGQVLSRLSALRGVELPWKGEEWIWKLAPAAGNHPGCSYQRRVIGISSLHEAGTPVVPTLE